MQQWVMSVIKSSLTTVWSDTLRAGMKTNFAFQSKQVFHCHAALSIHVEAIFAFQAILQRCKIHFGPLGAKPLQDFVKILGLLSHLIQI